MPCAPVSSTPSLRGWGKASWPWAGAGVCFAVCVCALCVCLHVPTVAGEEAQGPQSCPLMLCPCFVLQLSAGRRARTVGAAPSPADAPARLAGRGEPARQVRAVPLPSRLPESGLPHCCQEKFSGEQQSCHGALEVFCPQTESLVGDGDRHRGSSPSLGTCLVLLRPQRETSVFRLRTHTHAHLHVLLQGSAA